ncbi:hypothetical protein [Jannaschia seosinensis]|uniref:hypothetical protein n=1 Tax=Jannaschia seosinensis TaxID=313367 RepID=UPI000A637C77|nr:hypothetical protein [Jannaschia seosinensis]
MKTAEPMMTEARVRIEEWDVSCPMRCGGGRGGRYPRLARAGEGGNSGSVHAPRRMLEFRRDPASPCQGEVFAGPGPIRAALRGGVAVGASRRDGGQCWFEVVHLDGRMEAR